MRFETSPENWDGSLPFALVVPVASTDARRALLRDLVARALALPPTEVAIAHREGRRPRLMQPDGTLLHLSSASRGGLAAFALAEGAVGIDVEMVEPDRDLPLGVLHPEEAGAIESLSSAERAPAFACLWACKEAYLKALGLGLSRDPASFLVKLGGSEVRVRDRGRPSEATDVTTVWRKHAGRSFAVAVALLSR